MRGQRRLILLRRPGRRRQRPAGRQRIAHRRVQAQHGRRVRVVGQQRTPQGAFLSPSTTFKSIMQVAEVESSNMRKWVNWPTMPPIGWPLSKGLNEEIKTWFHLNSLSIPIRLTLLQQTNGRRGWSTLWRCCSTTRTRATSSCAPSAPSSPASMRAKPPGRRWRGRTRRCTRRCTTAPVRRRPFWRCAASSWTTTACWRRAPSTCSTRPVSTPKRRRWRRSASASASSRRRTGRRRRRSRPRPPTSPPTCRGPTTTCWRSSCPASSSPSCCSWPPLSPASSTADAGKPDPHNKPNLLPQNQAQPFARGNGEIAESAARSFPFLQSINFAADFLSFASRIFGPHPSIWSFFSS